jgi:hypothetical protein
MAKAEAEAESRRAAEKNSKSGNEKADKNVESLLRRVDKLEKNGKELTKEDVSEQK